MPMAPSRPIDGQSSEPVNRCRSTRVWLCLVLGLLRAVPAAGAPSHHYTPDFVIRSWSTGEGMPEGSATAVAQTPDGYLWVGTFAGLTRFNGLEFERVIAPEAGLVPTAMVTALLVTQDGRLWVSTGRGVFVFERRRLLRGYGQAGWPEDNIVRSWTETPAGVVAVTFNGHCLRFVDGSWQVLPKPDDLGGGFTVECDTAGQLWAMKDTFGYRWFNGAWQRLVTPEPRPAFRSLCRAHAGGVWFLSNTGLWRAEGERLWLERPGQSITTNPWSAHEDSQQRLWHASMLSGLEVFRPDGSTLRLTQTNGLTADSLRVAFEDRDGNVWLGSSGGGLMRFRDRRFTLLGRESGLVSASVNQLRIDRQGAVVASTQGGGVNFLAGNRFVALDPPRDPDSFLFAHATASEPDGTLWGAFDYGLCRRRGEAWERIEHPELGERKVRGVFVDRNGTVWAPCEGGLAQWQGTGVNFIRPEGSTATFVQLVDHPEGGLLAASSDHGLWHLTAGGVLQPVAREDLGTLNVSALLPRDGAVWFTVSDGRLGRLTARGVRFVNLPGVDAAAPILNLVDDALGHLWLGTARGLLRIAAADAAAAADGQPIVLSARAFGPAEGVANLEFRSNHQPSAVRDRDGLLWFATSGGLLRFDPRLAGPDLAPPVTAIRTLEYHEPGGTLGSGSRRLDDPPPHVSVPPRSSLFTFELDGLDFTAPESLRFRARLLPGSVEESPWLELSAPRVSFPLLPAGRYRFQATTARMGEPWNPYPVQVEFEIRAPWWQQPVVRGSALGVLAVTLLAGGGLLYSLRTRRFRERLAGEARRLDERRESERQNRLLRELLDQSADSIFVVTVPAGRLADASASVERRLGHLPAERPALSLSALGLLPPGQDWPAFLASLRAGAAVRFETALRHRDGRTVPAEVEARLSTRGGEEFVLAIARDISERQAAAQRERLLETQLRDAQKLEAVGRLAGGIAHDFNNLLQIIRGFTDILRQDPDMSAAAREDSLAEVSRAATRASDLTRQLLAFSRREAVEMRRCHLGHCVEESLRLLRSLVGPHIRIETELPGGLPWVLADAGQLGQVLLNLAANARDAMPHGGTIRLGLRETEFTSEGAEVPPWAMPGRGVELSFADSGAGIGPERLSRIFEPFYTTKERGKGTGLGLAVVYGIVQQHRGRITVDSVVGRGTTFRIVLPACVPGELPAAGVPVATLPAPSSEPRRILVVDDETTILQLAERVLSGAGHLVFPVADGAAAIRTFAANVRDIDLAILDVLMPGLTGWAVARELRRLRPDLPILFFSGYATEEGEREIAALPGARLLLKPFTPTELLVEVELLASQHPTKPG